MKLICLGDLHYRATTPRGRKDDYTVTHASKMRQALHIAREYGCRYMLLPGDLFDKAMAPYWLTRDVIIALRDMNVLAVLGQHDQRFHHGNRANTPIGVAEAAGIVRVLGKLPYIDERVLFYGASWGAPIPTIQNASNANVTRVLVMHRMVIQDKTIWPGQEDFVRATPFLRRQPYDLIVAGDHHAFFTARNKDRYLVNCGSLMRANIDQADHHPAVVVYDTEQRSIEVVPLDIAPALQVLKIEQAEKKAASSAELEAFVEQVGRQRGAPDLDFLAALHELALKASPTVRGAVNEIVGMSHGQQH